MACERLINLQQGILRDSLEGVVNTLETMNTE